MRNRFVTRAVAMVAILSACAVSAHHSISMFDISTPVWVQGTVVSFVAINPHALIVLDETTNDGDTRRWLIEGPSLNRLERMGTAPDLIQTGETLEVCGFAPKAEFTGQPAPPRTRGYPPQTVHGHLLVLPDGQMSLWGPYGKLENCVRPNDEVQTWVDFANTHPMVRSAWCGNRFQQMAPSVPAKEFVDEVRGRLTTPCD